MKRETIDELARRHGIGETRPSPEKNDVTVSTETKIKILEALNVDLDARDQPGNPLAGQKTATTKTLPASYLPPFLGRTRVWGVTLEPYALRSSRNWGIGDFQDLCDIARVFGPLGADFIGLTPLHAPFLADPDRCSPYEPSSRQRLNPLYIAVDRVPGYEPHPEIERRAAELRETTLVDYVGVCSLKLEALRDIWTGWMPERSGSSAPEDFETFIAREGTPLRLHALFEALSFTMSAQGLGAGWHAWPESFKDPESLDVAAFAETHEDEIRFHMWLQWLAHGQLDAASKAAKAAGMRIGLYLDLAVGEALDGAATWGERDLYVSAATVGSPPDPFAADGQDWHLAAFQPAAIASGDPSPYRRMVTAAMRYAGAIRIDHAAALRRLFLVPLDLKPDGGAYVEYPEKDLLGILAETSRHHECLVIGEDLGVLPDGLQDDLTEARILSYRILSYERTEDGFKPGQEYPALSLACISTHDHQTLAGWWRGADITTRAEHGILPPDITKAHQEERMTERKDLARALDDAGIEQPSHLPSGLAQDQVLTSIVVDAHRFIARTASALSAVRLADMTGEKNPTNVPGTSDSYPNWKPKLSVTLEALSEVPLLVTLSTVMREERPRS
ncbi:4-alpha-glucanotransferase [Rhizobium sp. 9140]|uniref:4-alpha-glucanotransferase n=1 Tax=Rhizobium sp. 9140 TaxID=1761900 RepID=UPI000798AE8F|nr:4-alpha-glucanotransferase [Rhizobium sp. 9140]CZT33274.1 4-alpha-glucanotransferase [Rhizobium sp. 9140]